MLWKPEVYLKGTRPAHGQPTAEVRLCCSQEWSHCVGHCCGLFELGIALTTDCRLRIDISRNSLIFDSRLGLLHRGSLSPWR